MWRLLPSLIPPVVSTDTQSLLTDDSQAADRLSNHAFADRMFCEHYQGVLNDPDGDAHANIRSFMKHGWDGITFSGPALRPRAKGDPQMAEGV